MNESINTKMKKERKKKKRKNENGNYINKKLNELLN